MSRIGHAFPDFSKKNRNPVHPAQVFFIAVSIASLKVTKLTTVYILPLTAKASGKDTRRPELEAMIAFVWEGDTVVVHSMDRLARNLDDLRCIVQSLTARGIRIEFVKEGLHFTGEDSPMAYLLLSVMVRRPQKFCFHCPYSNKGLNLEKTSCMI